MCIRCPPYICVLPVTFHIEHSFVHGERIRTLPVTAQLVQEICNTICNTIRLGAVAYFSYTVLFCDAMRGIRKITSCKKCNQVHNYGLKTVLYCTVFTAGLTVS